MLKFLIPLIAVMLGTAVLLASGSFADRHNRSGDAFLALLYATHEAALADRDRAATP